MPTYRIEGLHRIGSLRGKKLCPKGVQNRHAPGQEEPHVDPHASPKRATWLISTKSNEPAASKPGC